MLSKSFFRTLTASLLLPAGILIWSGWQATPAQANALSDTATMSIPLTGTVIPTVEMTPTPVVSDSPHDDADSNCMMCHANPNFYGTFEDNDSVSLYVSSGDLSASVHAEGGLKCVACHTNINRYPHTEKKQLTCTECHSDSGGQMGTRFVSLVVELPYPDKRTMVLDINDKCRTCHQEEFKSTDESAHKKVFKSGNMSAPVCVDCHGGHNTKKPGTPRTNIVDICAKCHETVNTSFSVSVHGETLLHDPTNPDVPTCISCHGVHSVRGPRQITFRGDSIVICGECHGNKELMAKYGISTDVFDTYLNDYHGRTVSLYQEAGKTSSNKATCFDCHGVHNIRRPTDSLSSVYPANLQHTCQQCHTDATIRFPQAWLSHVGIGWEKTPVLYVIKSVYVWMLIPGTIGAFVIYIFLDARRRRLDKRKFVLEALANEEPDDYDFEK
ncbi:MAG: hypothetical protein HZB50_16505 [Chloroflexi bacterium]|nr:hypothetical protein [Chloroflexota bacterium]